MITPEAFARAVEERYRVERELGSGGMAAVWLARDLKHQRPVALKLLRPELGAVLGAERFLREIRLTATLQHPHILPLLDSGEAAGQCYYVMPYVDGESLRQRLTREGPLPLDEALRLTQEVAEALAYAHGLGIIHRDIKPENLLLSRGHALVADFGIALAVSEAGGGRLTETGLSLGTPAYMSPEQALAEARLDGRTDQYSLACVLYEMLAGEPPYTGPTAQAVIAKRLSEPVPHLRTVREVPPELDQAVTRALSKAAVDRFATTAEFAAALASGSTIPTLTPVISPMRRRAPLLGAVLAVALLAAAAAAIWAGPRLRSRSAAQGSAAPRTSVAVLPFEVRGNPSLEYLREGLVELVSAKLDGTGDLRAVDPRALLSLVRRRPADATDPESARRLAEELGAGPYVLGSVLQVGDSLRLSATLYGTDGALQATAESGATERELGRAVDDLARGLIGRLSSTPAGRLASLGAVTTTSFPALRAYLAGQQAFRRSALDSALTAFRTAVALDSSFALAWYRLGAAAAWQNREDLWREAIEQAVRHADRLSARDRALLEANLSWREGRLHEAEQRYRAITSAHPDDVEAWFWLGDVWKHTNEFRGRSPFEAEEPFRRALALDPHEWQSALHLEDLLRLTGRQAAADSLPVTPWWAPLDSLGPGARTPERFDSLVAARVGHFGPEWDYFLTMLLLGRSPGMRETALRYARNLTSAANPPDWRALAHGLLATHHLSGGRWQEADAELAAGELLSPEHGVPYRALMALNSPLTVPESTFRHLRDQLLRWDADNAIQHSGSIQADARSWLDGAEPLAREYLLALIEIRLGQRDSAVARAARLGTMPAPARVGSLATDLAATVRAAAAWRSGDAAATLRELETQQFVIPDYRFVWPFFGQAEARMLRASALARLGRDREALGWLIGLQHPEAWSLRGVLIAPAWRLEGEIHEGAGRREKALRAYRRFLELWKDAGPEAQEQVRDVRARVAALAGESG